MANGKIAGLLAVLLGAVAALGIGLVAAQNSGVEVRIEARRLDDGRVEFALRERGGERILPRARYFPAETEAGRWLNASWITVGEGRDFSAAPTATPMPARTLGEWERFEGENVDGSLVGYSLTQDNDALLPRLVMRCDGGRSTEVFIMTDEYLPGDFDADRVSVTWRFSESSTPTNERWGSNEELDSTVFAPRGGSFRRALRNANGRLFIRITDNLNDTVSYEFNVQGASRAAAALGCNIGA